MNKHAPAIKGNLDIFIAQNEDNCDGEIVKWRDILIHGDPEGLRSLAALLIELADTNQSTVNGLPDGARHHIHLRPKYDLSNSSENVIVGRLDAKGTGGFYDRYIARENNYYN